MRRGAGLAMGLRCEGFAVFDLGIPLAGLDHFVIAIEDMGLEGFLGVLAPVRLTLEDLFVVGLDVGKDDGRLFGEVLAVHLAFPDGALDVPDAVVIERGGQGDLADEFVGRLVGDRWVQVAGHGG